MEKKTNRGANVKEDEDCKDRWLFDSFDIDKIVKIECNADNNHPNITVTESSGMKTTRWYNSMKDCNDAFELFVITRADVSVVPVRQLYGIKHFIYKDNVIINAYLVSEAVHANSTPYTIVFKFENDIDAQFEFLSSEEAKVFMKDWNDWVKNQKPIIDQLEDALNPVVESDPDDEKDENNDFVKEIEDIADGKIKVQSIHDELDDVKLFSELIDSIKKVIIIVAKLRERDGLKTKKLKTMEEAVNKLIETIGE